MPEYPKYFGRYVPVEAGLPEVVRRVPQKQIRKKIQEGRALDAVHYDSATGRMRAGSSPGDEHESHEYLAEVDSYFGGTALFHIPRAVSGPEVLFAFLRMENLPRNLKTSFFGI